MTWQKNDWQKVIDYITEQTKIQMEGKDKLWITDDPFGLLLKILSNGNFPFQIMDENFFNFDIIRTNGPNNLIVSALNKNDFFLRKFFKGYFFQVDFYPFINLFESDLCQIAKTLSVDYDDDLTTRKHFLRLLGKDWFYSHTEIEWATLEDYHYDIVVSDKDPSKNQRWNGYSAQQKELIAQIWQIEKQSRYKFKQPTLLKIDFLNR